MSERKVREPSLRKIRSYSPCLTDAGIDIRGDRALGSVAGPPAVRPRTGAPGAVISA
ncbi:hypothetical protein [Streptomyces sp. NPDC090021]|uniref:hypothetical protein n=1 Tax=Streptomyces sp. NPDC090021 TaxID=3365919 RepID=UPI003817B0D9